MLIAVGSTNPVKIEAVKEAFSIYFKNIKAIGIETDSKVSAMPYGDREAISGAINRAKGALKTGEADFGVGLEGAYRRVGKYGYFESPWFAIINKKGIVSLSGGGGFLIPENIVKEIKKGKELGEIMDKITGVANSKQKMGAIGFFTRGVIDRKHYYRDYIIMALIKFINKNSNKLVRQK